MNTGRLLAILEAETLIELAPLFEQQGITDAILGDLTDEDLKSIGISRLGDRKRLIAAFSRAETASPVQTAPAQLASEAEDTQIRAREDSGHAHVSSTGIPFVPVPEVEQTLIAIWPVRVRDYEAFCSATLRNFPPCAFAQAEDHPMVNVSMVDALDFSRWLTFAEREAGSIGPARLYRPTSSQEWSYAVGEKASRTEYPWGNLRFPPPKNAGNYSPALGVDEFPNTSPVGSFEPNQFGCYDLGGNVWEMCFHPLCFANIRGASWNVEKAAECQSNFSYKHPADMVRDDVGFRLALVCRGI
jgi:hypothetical protein